MRVHVHGAGIVGLVVAEELRRRGHDVVVVDPAPVSGASYAAAGMLSPGAEVWWGEESLLRLGLRSLADWPALAERLEVRLDLTGTLLVGLDADDRRDVERQAALLARLDHEVVPLDRREVRRREPGLTRLVGGVLLPGEGAVDPREVCAAVLRRLEDDGTPVLRAAPPERPDVTVLATGAQLPEPFADRVRGVRGEILRLRSDDPPTGVVRGWAHGEAVYLVPRGDGGVVLGATSEQHDGPPVVTAGGVRRLLECGRALWPALDRAELLEATARDRPATADGLPLIGPSGRDGVVLAAGHHRHGVLLAPLTARLVADHVDSGLDPGVVDAALDPRRLLTVEPPSAEPPSAEPPAIEPPAIEEEIL